VINCGYSAKSMMLAAAIFVVSCALFAGAARATSPGLNGKIAFISNAPPYPGPNAGSYIHTINPDGTGEATLQTACGYASGYCENSLYSPKWSPDGSKIAWSNSLFARIMNADGTGLASVTNSFDTAYAPPLPALRLPSGEALVAFAAVWSPDGTRLAIIGNGQSGTLPYIYTLKPDGTDITLIPNTLILGYNVWLSWSPDGTKIAFTRSESTFRTVGNNTAYDSYLAVADLVHGTVSDLTSHAGVPDNFFVGDVHPEWSPDGSKILYYRSLRDGFEQQFIPTDAYTVNSDASHLTQVTHSSGDYGPVDPTWSPDCTKIAYSQWDGNYNQIFIANADGTDPHAVTTGAYEHSMPDWQPLAGGGPVSCAPPPPVDGNGDGITDTLQPAGTAAGSFTDSSLTPPTTGLIIDRGGLSVTVTDAGEPTDGVQVTIGSGSGTAKLSVCGGFTIKLAAGSSVVITCGSVTVKVLTGSADVVLGGGVTVVTIPTGDTGYVDTKSDGSYVVKALAGASALSVTVDGVTAPIAPNSQRTVQTWHFVGFAQPVDNNGVLNVSKAGRVVPLKWRLLNAANQPVTNLIVANVSVATMTCASTIPTDAIEEYAAGASALQNLGNGYYQFNWQTPSTYANSCRTLSLDIGDGVKHTALFSFTK